MVNGHSIGSNDLQYALNITEIGKKELENNVFDTGFFHDVITWEEMKKKYISMKFAIWHIEQGNFAAIEKDVSLISASRFSMDVIIEHSAFNPNRVKEICLNLEIYE